MNFQCEQLQVQELLGKPVISTSDAEEGPLLEKQRNWVNSKHTE